MPSLGPTFNEKEVILGYCKELDGMVDVHGFRSEINY